MLKNQSPGSGLGWSRMRKTRMIEPSLAPALYLELGQDLDGRGSPAVARRGVDMHVACLTVEFFLEGCRSLKEKRHRLRGLRDRFGRRPNVAVCESGYQDDHQRGEWTFVVVASHMPVVQGIMDRIESKIEEVVDAEIADIDRDEL